jgi:hypothetical protein
MRQIKKEHELAINNCKREHELAMKLSKKQYERAAEQAMLELIRLVGNRE